MMLRTAIVFVAAICFELASAITITDHAHLVGYWNFRDGSVQEKTGLWPTTTEYPANACRKDGQGNDRCHLQGCLNAGTYCDGSTYNWVRGSGYTGPDISEITFVMDIVHHGVIDHAALAGGVTLCTATEAIFDGPVFSEVNALEWMWGSDGHYRTDRFNPGSYGGSTTTEFRLAMTLKKVGTDQTVSYYVDNVHKGTYTKTGTPHQVYSGNTIKLNMGKRHGGLGRIDINLFELAVFNRALSQHEIWPTATHQLTPSASLNLSNTPSQTATDNRSMSESKLPTVSPSPSQSVNATPSQTEQPSSTGSFPATASPTTSLSQLSTLSKSAVFTPSLSMLLTPTLRTSPTWSAAVSVSVSLTPPPTPTPTHTYSMTLIGTASESLTSTLRQTFTETLGPTATHSFSASFTPPIECSTRRAESCRAVDICQETTAGLCHHRTCELFSSFELCSIQGCSWSMESSACKKPVDCGLFTSLVPCERNLNCRWNADTDRCFVSHTRCGELETEDVCIGSECAWNPYTAPNCFRPVVAPELCVFVDSPLLCTAQSCLWFQPIQKCAPWTVSCKTLPPIAELCGVLDGCFYHAANRTCASASSFDFSQSDGLIILSSTVPSRPIFPLETFTVLLYGSSLGEHGAAVFFVPTGTSCAGASRDVNFTASSYNFESKASTVAASIAVNGEYYVCVAENATTSLGPFGNVTVAVVDPVLDSCVPSPSNPFADQPFKVAVKGTGLDNEARAAFVAFGAPCPNYNQSVYTPIQKHAGGESTAVGNLAQGNYSLCYANRGGVPAMCPGMIRVQGFAPWEDPEKLQEIARSYPALNGAKPDEVNAKNCKSLVRQELHGVMAHPNQMRVEWGDGQKPISPHETCIVIVNPMKIDGVGDAGAKHVVITVDSLSLDASDRVRIFVPAGVLASSCGGYGSRDACVRGLCTWDGVACAALDPTQEDANCPYKIPGYVLLRNVDRDVFADKKAKSLPIGTEGAMVVTCTTGGIKRGLGAVLRYKHQKTQCPNDCTDKFGTLRGKCIQRANSFVCECSSGYTGEDCSRKSTCDGPGALAATLSQSHATETFEMTSAPCGYNLAAEVPDSDSTRFRQYAVGISISSARLSSDDCSVSYIKLHEGSYKGPMVRRLCRNDLAALTASSAGGSLFQTYLPKHTQFYIEFVSSSGDFVTLTYGAVSLVCPSSAVGGAAVSNDAACDGRGACVPVDFAAADGLPDHAFTCDCAAPFASSSSISTCDRCAFGFVAKSFPVCSSATVCIHNCSDHGVCIDGIGCHCNAGWYGLDCNLQDDNERLGSLASNLEVRLPMNRMDTGNVVQSGSIDRTIMPCSLEGAFVPCNSEPREVGRSYDLTENSRLSSYIGSFSFRRRFQELATGSSSSGSGSDTSSSAAAETPRTSDEGIRLNDPAPAGSFPDFVVQENMSLPLASGGFTIAAWVKATADTRGFLFAKVDAVFTATGRPVVLEYAAADVTDRSKPLEQLRLLNRTENVYFAVHLDGHNKRVDLLATNPQNKHLGIDDKEDFMYVRHFRLGSKGADLFDGSWRFLALKLQDEDNRIEAQLYVDGYTVLDDPDFNQCLPFLPVEASSTSTDSFANRTDVQRAMPMPAVVWGYRYVGAVDEMQLFDKPLHQRSIVSIGGPQFDDVLSLKRDALVALMTVCAFVMSFVVLVLVARRVYRFFRSRRSSTVVPTTGNNDSDYDDGKSNKSNPEEGKHHRSGAWSDEKSTGSSRIEPSEQPMPRHRRSSVIEEEAIEGEVDDDAAEVSAALCPVELIDENEGEATTAIDINKMFSKQLNDYMIKLEEIVVSTLDSAVVNSTSNSRLDSLKELESLVVAAADSKKNDRAAAKTAAVAGASNVKAVISALFSNDTASSGSSESTGALVDTLQVLGNFSSALGMPFTWKRVFGPIAALLLIDFFPAFGVPFTPIYLTVFSLAMLSFLALASMKFFVPSITAEMIDSQVRTAVADRRAALENDVEYKAPRQGKLAIVMMVLGMALNTSDTVTTNRIGVSSDTKMSATMATTTSAL